MSIMSLAKTKSFAFACSAVVLIAAVLSLIGVLNDLRIGLDPTLLSFDVPTEDFTRDVIAGVPCGFLFVLVLFFLKEASHDFRIIFGSIYMWAFLDIL